MRSLRTALILAATLLVAFVVAGGVWFLVALRGGLPDPSELRRIGEMGQATVVFDAADRLAFTIFKEQRIDVSLEDVSPHMVDAILAIEDQRFYSHYGFDLIRIASAALADVRDGRASQGGSTITQQLARLAFLTPGKTLARKAQELILARRIERLFSKRQILELYLNKVYFGDGLYGVEAASRGFFGKHARELSVAEAALLAGLVKSPSTYAPTVRMDRAVARRNVVLQVMHDTGVIDAATWNVARTSPVSLRDTLRREESIGLYFEEQVRQELVERFGWQRVYEGGLRVFSTIDMEMQQAAEAAVTSGLRAIETRRAGAATGGRARARAAGDDAPLQAALIAMEPGTGHVRAMVGGRDFGESSFNRAVQARRQPGSAFKPFVYAAALEAGYTPATIIRHLNDPVPTLQGAWSPEDEHSDADAMSVREALRTSSNRAAVRVLQDVGIAPTVAYAKAMGVGDLPSVPSLALGSGDVTLQSLTAAYGAFANRGDVSSPVLIRRVEDRDGHELYVSQSASTHAIRETTAFLMASMMADVIDEGTGARARTLGFTLPAAGKTGTTNDYHDAWFVGFTPALVAGVWVGFDQPRTILPGGFAAQVAVPLWAAFMKAATKGDPPTWLAVPPGITTTMVCRLSGERAGDGCARADAADHSGRRSMVYAEYFARGTEPKSYCHLHPVPGFPGSLLTFFKGVERPAAPDVEEPPVAAPPTPAPSKSDASAAAAEADQPAKKRGFWSRLLHLGTGAASGGTESRR